VLQEQTSPVISHKAFEALSPKNRSRISVFCVRSRHYSRDLVGACREIYCVTSRTVSFSQFEDMEDVIAVPEVQNGALSHGTDQTASVVMQTDAAHANGSSVCGDLAQFIGRVRVMYIFSSAEKLIAQHTLFMFSPHSLCISCVPPQAASATPSSSGTALSISVPPAVKAVGRVDVGYFTKLINGLLRQKQAAIFFGAPVDPVALLIPTYFDVIKNPMDLGTIKV